MGRLVSRTSVAVFVAVLLTACTARLAPEHETAIVQGLTNLLGETETLLAAAANGTQMMDYASQRKNRYATLRGKARALLVLINSRPEPKPVLLRLLGVSQVDDISKDANQSEQLLQDLKTPDVPTDDQLEWFIEEIRRMEQADAKADLPKTAIDTFSKPIRRALRNAIIYEMALDR